MHFATWPPGALGKVSISREKAKIHVTAEAHASVQKRNVSFFVGRCEA